jgi:aspartyl-tRNA(Asn)/glutamyl-tRNA(Gln) amidotransferase subunit C
MVTRPDVVGQTLTPDQVLAGAPERHGDFFKVSSILGEEQ